MSENVVKITLIKLNWIENLSIRKRQRRAWQPVQSQVHLRTQPGANELQHVQRLIRWRRSQRLFVRAIHGRHVVHIRVRESLVDVLLAQVSFARTHQVRDANRQFCDGQRLVADRVLQIPVASAHRQIRCHHRLGHQLGRKEKEHWWRFRRG